MNTKVFITTAGNGLSRAYFGEGGEWEVEESLPEQDVRCLAKDQHNPDTVYAGTQGNGVWRSDDRGRTWKPVGLEGIVVKSIACSPTRRDTLYAGTRPAGIYKSLDGGESWHELESFRNIKGSWYWMSPAEPPFKAYVQSIALSPEDPQNIVVGIEAGAVVRSDDGGKTWSGHIKGAIRDCHSLVFHNEDGNWVYEAGGGGHGASFSRDGGRTWTQPKDGIDRRYGWACAADPEKPEVWYVSISKSFSWRHFAPSAHVDGYANAYIFRSVGGAAFEKLSGGLPQPLDYMAYGLLTDPSASGHLYAGLSNGEIYHTADYGDNWDLMPFNMGVIGRSLIMI